MMLLIGLILNLLFLPFAQAEGDRCVGYQKFIDRVEEQQESQVSRLNLGIESTLQAGGAAGATLVALTGLHMKQTYSNFAIQQIGRRYAKVLLNHEKALDVWSQSLSGKDWSRFVSANVTPLTEKQTARLTQKQVLEKLSQNSSYLFDDIFADDIIELYAEGKINHPQLNSIRNIRTRKIAEERAKNSLKQEQNWLVDFRSTRKIPTSNGFRIASEKEFLDYVKQSENIIRMRKSDVEYAQSAIKQNMDTYFKNTELSKNTKFNGTNRKFINDYFKAVYAKEHGIIDNVALNKGQLEFEKQMLEDLVKAANKKGVAEFSKSGVTATTKKAIEETGDALAKANLGKQLLKGGLIGLAVDLATVPLMGSRPTAESLFCEALQKNPSLALDPTQYTEDGGGPYLFCLVAERRPKCIEQVQAKLIGLMEDDFQTKVNAALFEDSIDQLTLLGKEKNLGQGTSNGIFKPTREPAVGDNTRVINSKSPAKIANPSWAQPGQ